MAAERVVEPDEEEVIALEVVELADTEEVVDGGPAGVERELELEDKDEELVEDVELEAVIELEIEAVMAGCQSVTGALPVPDSCAPSVTVVVSVGTLPSSSYWNKSSLSSLSSSSRRKSKGSLNV